MPELTEAERGYHNYGEIYIPVTQSKTDLDCDLDCDPIDAPVSMGHSLFNITKSITLLFIVQAL